MTACMGGRIFEGLCLRFESYIENQLHEFIEPGKTLIRMYCPYYDDEALVHIGIYFPEERRQKDLDQGIVHLKVSWPPDPVDGSYDYMPDKDFEYRYLNIQRRQHIVRVQHTHFDLWLGVSYVDPVPYQQSRSLPKRRMP